MRLNSEGNAYCFSALDIALMGEAGIRFNEMMNCTPKHPGLPPLWSRIPFLMLQSEQYSDTRFFWKAYRELDDLLKNADRHYAPAYIPKRNGKTRTLMVPDPELCGHQRLIHKEILCRIPISDYAFAYCKGRGLVDLAQCHIGHETLIHLDLRDFFSSITEQMVFEVLCRETGYPKSVAGFLSRLCCYRGRLPQGACTSPALSNLCFRDCDEEIAALAREHGLAYSRYSDDLFLSGNVPEAGSVIAGVTAILTRYGFRLRSEKTRVLKKHHAQRVTAIIVNEKMQVSREYRRKLRQELHYLRRFGPQAAGACTTCSYEHYLYHLLGKVAFVLYVDPGNREFLEGKQLLEQQLFG